MGGEPSGRGPYMAGEIIQSAQQQHLPQLASAIPPHEAVETLEMT